MIRLYTLDYRDGAGTVPKNVRKYGAAQHREPSHVFEMEKLTGDKRTHLVGSGNGVRKNKILQHYLEETFKIPLEIPANTEEAAFGATVFIKNIGGQ